MSKQQRRSVFRLRAGLVAAVLLVAVGVRGVGLYRGIEQGYSWHPDVAKQVYAYGEYLEGRYIWYTGLRYFDSYPLFLNHLDEWITRGIRLVTSEALQLTGQEQTQSANPKRDLYMSTLTFRWLYGVVVVLLTGWVARRLKLPFPTANGAMLLVALSTINITTSRFGTGDIACDLFLILTVLGCAGHARTGRWGWLALASLMAAWGFAGKYNAGMTVLLIGGYVFLACLKGEKRLVRFVGWSAGSALVFLAGVAVAMPQFTWAFRRTWNDMIRVIDKIKDYREPQEFIDLPLGQQMAVSLEKNLVPLLEAMGWAGVTLSLVGALLALWRWLSMYRHGGDHAGWRRRSLLMLLFLFPWGVILVSLSTKLNVQLCHFSWLYPPMALAGLYALWPLIAPSGRRWLRRSGVVVFALLLALTAGELAVRIPSELYFWGREDVKTLAGTQMQYPVLPSMNRKRMREVNDQRYVYRDYLLEPANVPHFRNRPYSLISEDAEAWRKMGVTPLPMIPFGQDPADWITLNGPVLPRNDAMFAVDANEVSRLVVVTHEPLDDCWIGFQAGQDPVSVKGRMGEKDLDCNVGAHAWKVLSLSPKPSRAWMDEGRSGKMIYHYPLTVKAGNGTVWVSIMRSGREVEVFRLFGGDEGVSLSSLLEGVDRGKWTKLVVRLNYLKGSALSQGPLSKLKHRTLHLWDEEQVLPAGPYVLDLEVVGLTPDSAIRVVLQDPGGLFFRSVVASNLHVSAGTNRLRLPFSKGFAPFQCQLVVEGSEGDLLVGDWSLKPDTGALIRDAEASVRPPWQRLFPEQDPPGNLHTVEATFGHSLKIHEVAWPDPLQTGQRQGFYVRASLLNPVRFFDEWEVIFHVVDSNQNFVAAAHVPVRQCSFSPENRQATFKEMPSEIDSGGAEASVMLEVRNRRTLQRLPLTGYPDHLRPEKRDMPRVGGIQISAPATGERP